MYDGDIGGVHDWNEPGHAKDGGRAHDAAKDGLTAGVGALRSVWKDLTDLRLDGSEGSDGSAKSLLFMSRLDLLLYMYH